MVNTVSLYGSELSLYVNTVSLYGSEISLYGNTVVNLIEKALILQYNKFN